MPPYEPRFWEIPVPPEQLDLLPTPERPEEEKEEKSLAEEASLQALLAQVRVLIQTRLTPKQREVVELYFFQEKSQTEIAVLLGVPQQVVSKHLFGVMRNGKKIGGAITKLQKICWQLGISPEKWV